MSDCQLELARYLLPNPLSALPRYSVRVSVDIFGELRV